MDLPRAADGGLGFPGTINLGNSHGFTFRQLAEQVLELTGSKSKLVNKPLPADYPMQRKPNIARAQELLGSCTPQVQLRDGLTKTNGYFDS